MTIHWHLMHGSADKVCLEHILRSTYKLEYLYFMGIVITTFIHSLKFLINICLVISSWSTPYGKHRPSAHNFLTLLSLEPGGPLSFPQRISWIDQRHLKKLSIKFWTFLEESNELGGKGNASSTNGI